MVVIKDAQTVRYFYLPFSSNCRFQFDLFCLVVPIMFFMCLFHNAIKVQMAIIS